MKFWKKNLILLALAVIICAVPLVLINSDFAGADSQVPELVAKLKPGFEPWVKPIVELPGSETEGLLFALQAAVGTGVLGFIIGRMTVKKGAKDAEN